MMICPLLLNFQLYLLLLPHLFALNSSQESLAPGLLNLPRYPIAPTADVSLLATFCDSPAEVALFAPEIPNTYDEAMSPDNKTFWEPGTKKEEDSIRENNTFELVDRKANMNVIPCRYVFRVQRDVGPKVCIFAMGRRQVPGVHYNNIYETYAPVDGLCRLCGCCCAW